MSWVATGSLSTVESSATPTAHCPTEPPATVYPARPKANPGTRTDTPRDALYALGLERLAELRKEHEAGRRMLADLQARQLELQETLLRIGGAVQVLEELLGPDRPEDGDGAQQPSAHGANGWPPIIWRRSGSW